MRELAVVVPAYNEEASIQQTLEALYSQKKVAGVGHYIVDNASTDRTRQVVEAFAESHRDFPVEVIEETEKGTGCAVNAGYRAAIGDGYTIIARTDADTLPDQNWTQTIAADFASDPDLHLLGGKRVPRRDDEWFRKRDLILWPAGLAVSRAFLSGKEGLGVIAGNNMATDAETFAAVGGFSQSSIETVDEDHVFENDVRNLFGEDAIGLDPYMRVATSMRRIRQLGYLGLARYRMDPESSFRQQFADNVDIRTTTDIPSTARN